MKQSNFFKCGHESHSDFYGFGKGAGRARAIAEYLNRPCYHCALVSLGEHVRTLTTLSGDLLWDSNRAACEDKLEQGADRLRFIYRSETEEYRIQRKITVKQYYAQAE